MIQSSSSSSSFFLLIGREEGDPDHNVYMCISPNSFLILFFETVSLIFVLLLFWGCSSCLLLSGLMIMKKGFDFQFNNMIFMIMFSFYDKLRHYFDHW